MGKKIGWTLRDNNRATREGWAFFESNDGTRLERIDEAEKFDGDGAAWRYARKRARAGSAFHRRALVHIKTEAPKEYAAIMAA